MAKTSKVKNNILKRLKGYLLPTVLSITLLILTIITYEVIMSDKYYPLTFVGDTNISFLSEGQAIRVLQSKFNQRSNQSLQFKYPQASAAAVVLPVFTIDIATSSASLDYSALEETFASSHGGTFTNQFQKQLSTLFWTNQVTPKVSLDLDQQMINLQSAVDVSPQNAQLLFDETTTPEGSPSARIQIKEGVNGLILDKEKLIKAVSTFLLNGQYNSELPIKPIPPKITTEYVSKAKQALENTLTDPIKLNFQNSSWTIDTKQLLTLLDLTSGNGLLLDKDKTYQYLGAIAAEINQDVQEGQFEFDPTNKRVSVFKPSQEGRKLNLDKTYQMLTDVLSQNGSKNINLPIDTVEPKIQTADVNSLGIKELLGRGISNFAGSIPNRIYNVNLTAQKINGVLIPPGEVFSFNQTVGDISAATGFKQAYVIKEGRTVLDDGGGVCQDSTTLFRAVLNAGLPVLKRTAHAYRVGYYEQGFPPGLDATVYYPSVDFQFKNDTQHYILVQAYTSGLTLYVDLYGTSDGRTISLTTPIVTNITPAPPDLRQDDPTLPKGTIKQVDFAARGATVSFNRTVTRGGETLAQETWKSFYKPWQAIFLVGTQ